MEREYENSFSFSMRVGDLKQNNTIGDETFSNFYAILSVDALFK